MTVESSGTISRTNLKNSDHALRMHRELAQNITRSHVLLVKGLIEVVNTFLHKKLLPLSQVKLHVLYQEHFVRLHLRSGIIQQFFVLYFPL